MRPLEFAPSAAIKPDTKAWKAQMKPEEIVLFLRARRFPLNDEKALQAMLSQEFSNAGIEHEREVVLAPGDKVDFMVGAVAIEVKIRESKRKIYNQCARYMEHERVSSLVLLTATAIGLPPEICGKPIFYVSLSRSWL